MLVQGSEGRVRHPRKGASQHPIRRTGVNAGDPHSQYGPLETLLVQDPVTGRRKSLSFVTNTIILRTQPAPAHSHTRTPRLESRGAPADTGPVRGT